MKFYLVTIPDQLLNIMTTTKEEADDAMKAKKELIEQRMKDRQNERETERLNQHMSIIFCSH